MNAPERARPSLRRIAPVARYVSVLAAAGGPWLSIRAAAQAADPPSPPPAEASPERPEEDAEPSFPAALSIDIRARYYRVHNLYDKNNKNDDELNLGTERIRVRVEGSPVEGVTVRAGGFQVHSIGVETDVVDWPSVRDEQDRPFEIDRAHVEWRPTGLSALALTAGRQDIVLGNGFLVGDGVRIRDLNNLLGYLEDNRQDFDAVRVDWREDGWALAALGARAPDVEGGMDSVRDLYLAALDAEAELAAGQRAGLTLAYLRDERPRADLHGEVLGFPFTSPLTPWTADDFTAWTFAAALRARGPIAGPLGYSLEGVWQIGRSPNGANDNTLAPAMVPRRAWGADARLVAFLHPERSHLVQARHVWLSGDRPGEGDNQFDPMFENQLLGALFNAQTNIQAWNVGWLLTQVEDWRFGLDLWRFRFDRSYYLVLPYGTGRNGYRDAGVEIDVQAACRWSAHWETELSAGVLWPGCAWMPDNNNPLGFHTSDDLVWGIRVTLLFLF